MSVVVGWTDDEALAERCLPRDQREHPDYNLFISQESGKEWGSKADTVFVIRGEHRDPNHQTKRLPCVQDWLERTRHIAMRHPIK